MKKKSIHRGLFYRRIKHNPTEALFAAEWEASNERLDTIGVMHALFTMARRKPRQHERVIAATIIQWLGSNPGLAFLDRALERAGYRIVTDIFPSELRDEHTSRKVAREAGRVLNDPKSSKRAKRIAGSALTQARNKKGKQQT